MEAKKSTSIETLCEGLPSTHVHINALDEFREILKYCRELKFEDDPDYNFIKQQLKNAFTKGGYVYDFIFDWNTTTTAHSKRTAIMHAEIKQSKPLHEKPGIPVAKKVTETR